MYFFSFYCVIVYCIEFLNVKRNILLIYHTPRSPPPNHPKKIINYYYSINAENEEIKIGVSIPKRGRGRRTEQMNNFSKIFIKR